MFSFEWENFTRVVKYYAPTIEDHGPLSGPVHSFSISRRADLRISMDAQGPLSLEDAAPNHPLGTVRFNEDTVTFRSTKGLCLRALGVTPAETKSQFIGTSFTMQSCRIHRLSGTLAPEDRSVRFTIDWLENVDPAFFCPNMVELHSETTTTYTFGRPPTSEAAVLSGMLEAVGSHREDRRSWSCVRLSIDGTDMYLCQARDGIAEHVSKPGFLIYHGNPSEDLRARMRRCLSFSLRSYLVHLGSSWFDADWSLVCFDSFSPYTLDGKAVKLPPAPPAPLGKRAFNEIDRDVLGRAVTAIFRKYDELNFGVVSWAYWHAVTAAPHIAAVHFGAALECLLRAYSRAHRADVARDILGSDAWDALLKGLDECVLHAGIGANDRETIRKKLQHLNSRSPHSLAKDLMERLGLTFSSREIKAYDARHESAHGKSDAVDVEWIRTLKLLRIRFNRVVLAMASAADCYYDYFTLGHPVHNLADPVPD